MSAFERIASLFNGTAREEEEEEQEPRHVNNNRENSTGTGIAIGAAAAVGVFAAWGISKLLSDNTDSEDRVRGHHSREPQVRNPPIIVREGEELNKPCIWAPPSPGRFKMNTDANCRPKQVGNGFVERGPCGYGGILRDHHGNWVRGFIGYLDEDHILGSELRGILEGLKLLDKPEYHGAILETDCKAPSEWVNWDDDHRQTAIVRASQHLIQECKVLAHRNNITIKHIPGRSNRCADKLANIAIREKLKYLEIKRLPVELKDLVEEDANFNN